MDDVTPDIPPSAFARMGQPCCSKWGKSEIEWIALAYVQALANDGDTWKRLSMEQTNRLLTDEQRANTHGMLEDHGALTRDFYGYWFELVSNQITDSAGAWGVGGFWNPWRYEKQRADCAFEKP